MTLHINGAAQGGGGTVAAADITDAGATGVALVQADDVGDLATAFDDDDAMSGTGWSANTPSGSATATWGSSKLACVCPVGSAASCGSSKAAYLASGQWYDLAARIRVIAGDGSSATRVGFAVGPSASSNVSINLWTSGTVECGYFNGATYTAFAFPAGTSSGDRTGGELWLRISRTPTGVAFAWGVGSAGARPTTWTVIHVATSAVALLHSGGKRLELFALTTGSLQFETDFLAVEFALPGGF